MSKSMNLITKELIKSMIEDCNVCTPGEPAKPVTIDELAEAIYRICIYLQAKPVTIDELAEACKKAAPLYMETLKEYLLEEKE